MPNPGNCTKIKDESVISILFVYSRTKAYWYRTFLTRSELSIHYIFFIRIRNTALISSVFAYRYSRTKPYICSQIRAVDSFYLIKSPNHSVVCIRIKYVPVDPVILNSIHFLQGCGSGSALHMPIRIQEGKFVN